MDQGVQETAPQRHAQRARLPAKPFVAWTAVVAGFIALYEVDRLISGAISADGSSRRLVAVLGPVPWPARDAWRVWSGGDFRTEVTELLVAGAVALAFLVGGALLLARRLGRRGWWSRLWLRLVALSGLAAVVLVLAGAGVVALADSPLAPRGWLIAELGWAVTVVVVALWAAVLALTVTTLRSAQVRSGVGRWSRRLVTAIWYHRVSLVFVVAMALLTLVPQRGVWDQLPDVERQWLSGGGAGVVHAVAAMLATILAAVGLFVLGRARTNRAWRTLVDGAPRQPGNLWWPWLLSPAVAAVVVLGMVVTGFAGLVDAAPLAVFVGVPLSVVVTSALLRRWRPALWAVGPKPRNELLAVLTWRLGDGLAVAVLWIGLLGLVRSFLAPALVSGSPVAWLLVLVGVVGAFAMFPAARRLLPRVAGPAPMAAGDGGASGQDRLRRRLDPSTAAPTWDGWRSAAVVFAVAGAVLAALMVVPVALTEAIGVIATALAALGAWAAIVGLLLVTLQDRQPAEVFRLLRLEAPPFIALLIVPAVLLASVTTSPDLHGVRTRGPVQPVTQQAPDEAFAAWLARGQGCELAVEGVSYRVLLLVAAQGGGARAADWTVRSMRELADVADECGAAATFLSSGVSGGSVGLAMSRGEVSADGAGAVSRPRALGGAVAGLFVGDLVGGSTGLRVPSAPVGDGGWQWRDRAGLIESVWEDSVPALDEDWAAGSPADDPGPTGLIVLNSVSTGDGCRVVLSQLDLTVSPTASPERADVCRGRTDQPAVTVDLTDVYGGCLPGLSWATAAMLSARFPIVTPAARVSPGTATAATQGYDESCGGGGQDLQLVDGGYAEGTGLATLSDITPLVLREVVAHNATAVSRDEPVVVPVVVFLQNVSRADLRQPPPRLAAEPLVPLQGSSAAALQSADGAWLQRLSDQFADPCPTAEDDCALAVAEVRRRIPDGVAVVAPLTEPAVEAPLGWVLSGDSSRRLENAMVAQATSCDGPEPGGYGRLYDVLALVRGDTDPCGDG